MSDFERNYQIDPSREQKVEIERQSIELFDFQLLSNKIAQNLADLVNNQENSLVKEIIDNAKSTSKRPKKANKNVSSKPHKPAVARVQKKV